MLGLEGGQIGVADVADLTVIDPSHKWTVSAETLRTKSANTPLLGMTLQGRAVLTLVAGKVLHNEFS